MLEEHLAMDPEGVKAPVILCKDRKESPIYILFLM